MSEKFSNDENLLSKIIAEKMEVESQIENVENKLIPYKEKFQDSILELDDLCENINSNIDLLHELEYDDMEYTDDDVLEQIEQLYKKLLEDSQDLQYWLNRRKKIRDNNLVDLQKEYSHLFEKRRKV